MSRLPEALALAAVLVACGGKSHPATVPASALGPAPASAPAPARTQPPADRELTDVAPQGTTAKPAETASPSTMTIPARQATVALVKAGKGAKQKLAFALAPGKQHVHTSLAISAEVSAMNKVVMPKMDVEFDVEVTKVDADGTAHLKETISKIDASDTPGQSVPSDKLGEEVSALTGMTIETTLSPAGQLGDELVTIPSGAKIDQESLEQMVPQTVMFPPDAVGVGARWTATQKGWGNMDATETTTYSLVSRNGDAATLEVDVAITAPKQDVSGEGSGEKVELTKLDGKGAAKVDASTKSPIAAGSSSMSISMQMKSATKTVDMKMDATSTTAIE